MITKYVTIGSVVIISLLSVSLYFTGKWALSERDSKVKAEYENKLLVEKARLKEELQRGISKVRDDYSDKLDTLQKDLNNERVRYAKLAATATNVASQKPVEFGDDVLRDFIRIDCLWNAGREATNSDVRSACRREAEVADPAASGLFFSVANPEFIKRWGEACRELETFGGGDEWRDDNPGITEAMCVETILMMTPETSVFLRQWVDNGEDWSTSLILLAEEQEALITALTTKPSAAEQ